MYAGEVRLWSDPEWKRLVFVVEVESKSLKPAEERTGFFAHARADIPAGAVVFLVALPLCLGVAQASGAPPLAGLLAGIIGGLLIPIVSRSPLSVSGPAAGLTVLVFAAIEELGFSGFLLALLLAGGLQIAFGIARLGLIAHFLPSAVIKGMLAAIGILIILKQIPHAVGYDKDFEGDEAFVEPDGHNTFTAIADAFGSLTWGAIVVSVSATIGLLLWPTLQKRFRPLRFVPVPLTIVAVGSIAAIAINGSPGLRLEGEHLVNLPVLGSMSDFVGLFQSPDFSRIGDTSVWSHAITPALVASIETLLCIEAVDGLDPQRRISPTNRELVAQGLANGVAGLIGAIPVTSVIVRSSANVLAGGRTALSTVTHGALLLVGLLFCASVLNSIPLAALAIVLIQVGAKLSSVSLWKEQWKAGFAQFVPFAATVLAILGTDLLKGTMIGALIGLAFMVRAQQRNAILVTRDDSNTLVTFVKDITFLQKAQIKEILRQIPDGARVSIDRRAVAFVDRDVDELLVNFDKEADARAIQFSQVFEPGGEARFSQRVGGTTEH
jgi:MFS superfamily sulfate permease-like transporter